MSGEEEEGTAFLPKARKTGTWTSVKGSDGVEGPKREGENVPDEPEETKELASHGNFDVDTAVSEDMVSTGVIKTNEEEEEEGWSWSKLKSKCLHIWRNITVEPVVIFYCLVVALSGIPGEEMYVKKACLVNLNHTREVCDNIYDHKEIQLETQKLVSGLQAKSGILKSVPGIVFILFAGPLSDSYGRKLFLLLSLFGYISLNIVFLVNSIWFMELRVEYLLFECLQEVTGGSTMFYLSAKAYLCDITTPEERTTRMAVADAFMSIGWLVGMPAGTRIKKNFGYTALFATTLAIAVTGFLYTLIFLKDSVKLLSEEQRKAYYERKKKEAITCDTGVVGNSFGLVLSSFKALFKKRNKNNRLWIIMFVLIFALPTVVNAGYGVVGYLFYRLQYNISTETYSDLISAWFVVNMFAQLVTVPFLSNKLGLQDTTIILLAIGPAVLGFFAEAWRTEVWALFVIWIVMYHLYYNIFTTTRSAVSKLVEPEEVGKIFTIIGFLESTMQLVAKPIFGLIYQATLHILPSLWLLIMSTFLVLTFVIALVTHIGMARERKTEKELETIKMSEKVDSS